LASLLIGEKFLAMREFSEYVQKTSEKVRIIKEFALEMNALPTPLAPLGD
jgi:hypothetical protein